MKLLHTAIVWTIYNYFTEDEWQHFDSYGMITLMAMFKFVGRRKVENAPWNHSEMQASIFAAACM